MAQKTQTAMQIGIEFAELLQEQYKGDMPMWLAIQRLVDELQSLLPVEREQIKDAVEYGDAHSDEMPPSLLAGNYYTSTYQQNT